MTGQNSIKYIDTKNTVTQVTNETRKLISVHVVEPASSAKMTVYSGAEMPVTSTTADRIEINGISDGVYTLPLKAGHGVNLVSVVVGNGFQAVIAQNGTFLITVTATMTLAELRTNMSAIRTQDRIADNFVVTGSNVGTVTGTATDTMSNQLGIRPILGMQMTVPEFTLSGANVFSILDIHRRMSGGMWVQTSSHDAKYLVVYS